MSAAPLAGPRPADPSWWLAEALAAEGNPPPAPPLRGDLDCDVAIIGGGFTGLWTALALQERRPPLKIVVIEAALCGAGASGRSGGQAHGYWSALPRLAAQLGDSAALSIARAGALAQQGLRRFARIAPIDIWWRDGPRLVVSTAPAQDAALQRAADIAQRLDVGEMVRPLDREALRRRCESPVLRGGILYAEGASLHPARLCRALRAVALSRGITLHERTPMTRLQPGMPNLLTTPEGAIRATEVVLATHTALAQHPAVRPHVSVFSSYAVMTAPAPELLARFWPGEEGLADARIFGHAFRKTPDGRVLMGSGCGPLAFDGREQEPAMRRDTAAAARALAGLRRLLPQWADVPVEAAWGGPVDVAADQLPFFRTLPGSRVHVGTGFSGHGVNPSWIAGQCLASLVLGSEDEWTRLPFCTRQVPHLPPEPFRWLGGSAIRWGIMACEAAAEQGRRGPALARGLAGLPERFGLRIGMR